MKIKYEFADGEVEVDVPNEWASILVELDRLERNNDKKERRRHYSLVRVYMKELFMHRRTKILRQFLKQTVSSGD